MEGIDATMERITRKPTQKRSLEKYERIIDAALKLFSEQGYYNVTTADIAKEANVATGSIYSYFEDKKDIYIQVLRKITEKFLYPTKEFWQQNRILDFNDSEAIKNLFREFSKLILSQHNFSKTFHDEITALNLLDKDINTFVKKQDEVRVENIRNVFDTLSIPFKSKEDSNIFLYYSNLLIDDVCHKILYDKTVNDIDLYIERVVDMLYSLFKSVVNV
jgi:AcrR family transcriptional regulator